MLSVFVKRQHLEHICTQLTVILSVVTESCFAPGLYLASEVQHDYMMRNSWYDKNITSARILDTTKTADLQ